MSCSRYIPNVPGVKSGKQGKTGIVLLLSKEEPFVHHEQYRTILTLENITAVRSWIEPVIKIMLI